MHAAEPRPGPIVRGRFFYGWVIVAITFVTSMLTAGVTGYGLAFFILPMSAALGVSRGAFSSITLFRLVLIPVVPLLGMLADKRHGPRLLITIGGAVAGLTLMLTAAVHSFWQFLLVFGVIFGLATTMMGGQVVEPAVIAKWFIRKRGRAMAIGTMGISAGGLVIAPLAGWLVGAFDWRVAWVVLGLLLFVAIVPMAALFMRRSPEDMGLLPDGDTPDGHGEPGAAHGASATDVEYPWTLGEALRTRALWLLLGVQTFGFAGLMPVIIHQVAYIQDKGHDLAAATALATMLAFFAMVAKLPWGYLAERFSVRWLSALCAVLAGLSVLILVTAQSTAALAVYAVCLGLTMGGFPTLMNVALAVYFGRQHMGAIRGVTAPVTQIMGAASPVFAGWMWDRAGSYDVAFIAFAFAWFSSGLLMAFSHPPQAPTETR